MIIHFKGYFNFLHIGGEVDLTFKFDNSQMTLRIIYLPDEIFRRLIMTLSSFNALELELSLHQIKLLQIENIHPHSQRIKTADKITYDQPLVNLSHFKCLKSIRITIGNVRKIDVLRPLQELESLRSLVIDTSSEVDFQYVAQIHELQVHSDYEQTLYNLCHLRQLRLLNINFFRGELQNIDFSSFALLEYLKLKFTAINQIELPLSSSLLSYKNLQHLQLDIEQLQGGFLLQNIKSLNQLRFLECINFKGTYLATDENDWFKQFAKCINLQVLILDLVFSMIKFTDHELFEDDTEFINRILTSKKLKVVQIFIHNVGRSDIIFRRLGKIIQCFNKDIQLEVVVGIDKRMEFKFFCPDKVPKYIRKPRHIR